MIRQFAAVLILIFSWHVFGDENVQEKIVVESMYSSDMNYVLFNVYKTSAEANIASLLIEVDPVRTLEGNHLHDFDIVFPDKSNEPKRYPASASDEFLKILELDKRLVLADFRNKNLMYPASSSMTEYPFKQFWQKTIPFLTAPWGHFPQKDVGLQFETIPPSEEKGQPVSDNNDKELPFRKAVFKRYTKFIEEVKRKADIDTITAKVLKQTRISFNLGDNTIVLKPKLTDMDVEATNKIDQFVRELRTLTGAEKESRSNSFILPHLQGRVLHYDKENEESIKGSSHVIEFKDVSLGLEQNIPATFYNPGHTPVEVKLDPKQKFGSGFSVDKSKETFTIAPKDNFTINIKFKTEDYKKTTSGEDIRDITVAFIYNSTERVKLRLMAHVLPDNQSGSSIDLILRFLEYTIFIIAFIILIAIGSLLYKSFKEPNHKRQKHISKPYESSEPVDTLAASFPDSSHKDEGNLTPLSAQLARLKRTSLKSFKYLANFTDRNEQDRLEEEVHSLFTEVEKELDADFSEQLQEARIAGEVEVILFTHNILKKLTSHNELDFELPSPYAKKNLEDNGEWRSYVEELLNRALERLTELREIRKYEKFYNEINSVIPAGSDRSRDRNSLVDEVKEMHQLKNEFLSRFRISRDIPQLGRLFNNAVDAFEADLKDSIESPLRNDISQLRNDISQLKTELQNTSKSIDSLRKFLGLESLSLSEGQVEIENFIQYCLKADVFVPLYVRKIEYGLKEIESVLQRMVQNCSAGSVWKKKIQFVIADEEGRTGVAKALSVIGTQGHRQDLLRLFGKDNERELQEVTQEELFEKYFRVYLKSILDNFMQFYLWKGININSLSMEDDFIGDGIKPEDLESAFNSLKKMLKYSFDIRIDSNLVLFRDKYDSSKYELGAYPTLTKLSDKYDEASKQLPSNTIYDIMEIGWSSEKLRHIQKTKVVVKS